MNNEEQLHKLAKRIKARNLHLANLDSEVFAKANHQKRIDSHTNRAFKRKSSGEVREIGMIPLTVFNMLPDEIKNDNNKLAEWLATDEFGKYFKTVEKF